MLIQSSSTASPLEEFKVHLRTGRYAAAIQRHYLRLAQRFVEYLGENKYRRRSGLYAGVGRLLGKGASKLAPAQRT